MQDIIKRLANLLTVKSLVTVILTIVFSIITMQKIITGEQFLSIFTVIIAFYFGTQATKEK